MGKGDKKTAKGKIIMGSHGKKRPKLKGAKNQKKSYSDIPTDDNIQN